jgi:rSAM/selenodomain-associated transferase 2/rSAM/selenodomain-associated transferase 1
VTARPPLSVVIPTLDEAGGLPLLLSDLQGLATPFEVIVADGGSRDGTVAVASASGARVVTAGGGRGPQLRAGAAHARGQWLFFVHADCRLDASACHALDQFVQGASSGDFAHFAFALDDVAVHARLIEFGQRLRQRALGMPYGDQGLIVLTSRYHAVGGFPDWPIMEDVGLIDLLAASGTRHQLEGRLLTSGRRYRSEGMIRAWARNAALIMLFRLGVSPHRLARWYRPRRAAPGASRCIVAIFAKIPEPGRVKTRLAADIGDAAATAIYRRLGRDTVDALRGPGLEVVVYVDPAGEPARAAAADWLGPEGLEFRPQAQGDLGARMDAALTECLGRAKLACVIGTDTPGIDRSTMAEAFEALERHDVVIGPATDGGYYLIGLRRPTPHLFSEISWSTDSVLSQTLERAGDIGASVTLLGQKSDVDVLADVPKDLLPEP